LIWGYFRLFETKDRTFGELDFMVSYALDLNAKRMTADVATKFTNGVTARQSAKYRINEEVMYSAEETVKS
jgi:MFS transporter, SP family, general alpha glucoside:H+ symporter